MTSRLIRYPFAGLLLLAGWLHAQTPTEPTTPERRIPVEKVADKEDDETLRLDEVEVTGSRIRTLVQEQGALPVFTIPQIELERRGVNRLADIRWAIPQLGGAVGFNDNLMNSGTSRAQTVGTSFNLRGLGGNSTLVLVDGRRIPHTGQEAPGGAGGREDFNIDGIPISAIERIDILPQGAGAVYGSEAIAGVINVVLKKNYSGAELKLSYDNTFDSDVGQLSGSLTAGHRAGKLSTFLTASWEKQNSLASRDRWWTATNDLRRFGSTSTNFLYSTTGGSGSLASGWYPGLTVGPVLPGQTSHVVLIPTGSNGSTAANAAAQPVTADNVPLYDNAQYATGVDSAERLSLLFRAGYQVGPQLELYGDVRWSEFENDSIGSPIQLTTQLAVGAPGNPFSAPVYLSKVFYDLPRPRTISTQKNLGAVLGARGNFIDTWRYDVSASWARNVVADDALSGSSFNFSLLNAALASGAPPMLAYDSINGTNPNPAGLLESLMPFGDHKDTTDVFQYVAAIDGVVWDGWAGPVRAALGAEAGEEKVKFWRDAAASFSYLLSDPFSRRHHATFAEVSFPLLSEQQGIPLIHRFELGGAVRYTDFSDAGDVVTPTYRVLFQPVKWITLRASRAEGFKPVRLYDLQAPVTSFTSNLTTTSNVRDPLRGNELVLGSYTYRSGGNAALNPEESISRNAGVVVDAPGRWLKGLSFSADYYEIDYVERSGSTGLQVLLNYFPERITRAAPTAADIAAGYAGALTTWDASNINLAGVWTKGWDYRATYSRTFGFGDLLISAAYSDPDVIITQSTPAAAPTSTFGHQPAKFSGSVFWGRGAWDAGFVVNYQKRYFIGGLNSTSYPSYIEWNPQVSYNFGNDARFGTDATAWWGRWLAGSKLTVTVINAFEKEPALADAAIGRFAGDPRLRRYIVSFAKKF